MASLLCAAASGIMFAKWKKLSAESRLRIWELYGWFCGLMFLGSMILALSIVAWMGFLVNFYVADSNAMNTASQTERMSDDMYMAQVRRCVSVNASMSVLDVRADVPLVIPRNRHTVGLSCMPSPLP
jgi:hypothetical protein